MNNFDKVKFNGAEMDIVKLNGEVVWENLPYVELDYIENTTSSFINTGIIASDSIKCVVKYIMPEIPSAYSLFGGRQAYLKNMYGMAFNVGVCRGQFATSVMYGDEYAPEVGSVATTELSSSYFKVNDNEVAVPANMSITPLYDIYLFCQNESGGAVYYFIGKIKQFEVYENDILIQRLIPCRRKSDDVICMYDTVSDQFFTNQGTGTFLAGSEI